MDISQLRKGALPDPIDQRDYQASEVMGAPVVDWNTPFKLPNPGDEDQGTSLSCVAHAWSFYHNQIHAADYSRRDLYARIFIPGSGGAFIRSGGEEITNRGQATRDEVPDPSPQTEMNMRDKTGVTEQAESSHKEMAYFVLPGDIDSVAAAIKNYSGVVFGVTGSNPGWQDLSNPRPPKIGEETWGHALYAYGYHLHDGQKCIITKSSWCNSVLEHHIKENYFITGFTFNPWTLIPKEQTMNQAKIVVSKKSPTVYICYPVPSQKHLEERTSLEGITIPNPIPNTDSL
jgi:hypothetical protein